jgi:CRP-like cAMP-binding protein
MELVGRMMDGSIPLDSGLEPSSAGPGVDPDDRIERLESVPLFEACTRRQLKSIARICETFDAPTGTVLTRVGEPGEEFFLIVDGAVRVEVSPQKQVRLGAGEYFGEMSLLDGEPRSATVLAESGVRLLVIRRRSFHELLDKTPGIGRNLLVTLSRRVREAERALTRWGPT